MVLVAIKMVRSCGNRFSNRWYHARAAASKLVVGSSRNNREALDTMAKPSFNRCFMPEDRSRTKRLRA